MLATAEVTTRGCGYYGAPVVTPLTNVTAQGGLDLLSEDALRVTRPYKSFRFVIAMIMRGLIDKARAEIPGC